MTTQIERHFSAYKGELNKHYNFSSGYRFLDLTLGDAGHTQEALDAGCQVVSFDVDQESISRSVRFLAEKYTPIIITEGDFKNIDKDNIAKSPWIIINSNFVDASSIIKELNLPAFDGIMIDLGPSQYQVLSPERGFSFNSEAILDMRLDKNLSVLAKDLVNGLNEGELRDLFILGDEPFAKPIARVIAQQRKVSPITTCKQLADIISRVKGRHKTSIHPATQVFMTLRMAVNLERESIQKIISSIPSLLKSNGVAGIISFHSTEDRLVKEELEKLESQNLVSAINKKPIEPSIEELKISNRTRSAKLRLVKKHL